MNGKLPGSSELQNQIAEWAEAAEAGTFEDALAALEAIVALLDQGNLALDDSVWLFEVGTRLSARCQQLLESAELRISTLIGSPEYDDDAAADPWLEGEE